MATRQLDYDLAVIGCGPAGEKAAVRGAYLGKRVVVIERAPKLGGQCLRGGLPSKVLREAALSYSGARRRLGDLFRSAPGHRLPMEWFAEASAALCDDHVARAERNLVKHEVTRVSGEARFLDPHTLGIDGGRVTASVILIATGSRPELPAFVPFGAPNVFSTDTLLDMPRLPKSMIVVGAGAIGAEYASIFATLDVQTSVIDVRPRILPFLDDEIADHLVAEMRRRGVRMLLGAGVTEVRSETGGVIARTESGEARAEVLLYAGGRIANTEALDLERIGVELGRNGRPVVNEHFQTTVPHVYAAGDVIGFPALASTSMEQGRVAVTHAFLRDASFADREDFIRVEDVRPYPLLPYGIYTIPSVSAVGQTEAQVAASGRPYVVGRARYADRPRGPLAGDTSGLLKLLADRTTRRVLGVHIVGEQAEELIHLGQACMHFEGTFEYFLRSVFNFPTLASLYKSAAYDALASLAPRP
jgi:NAD(P) transhydrogenase